MQIATPRVAAVLALDAFLQGFPGLDEDGVNVALAVRVAAELRTMPGTLIHAFRDARVLGAKVTLLEGVCNTEDAVPRAAALVCWHMRGRRRLKWPQIRRVAVYAARVDDVRLYRWIRPAFDPCADAHAAMEVVEACLSAGSHRVLADCIADGKITWATRPRFAWELSGDFCALRTCARHDNYRGVEMLFASYAARPHIEPLPHAIIYTAPTRANARAAFAAACARRADRTAVAIMRAAIDAGMYTPAAWVQANAAALGSSDAALRAMAALTPVLPGSLVVNIAPLARLAALALRGDDGLTFEGGDSFTHDAAAALTFMHTSEQNDAALFEHAATHWFRPTTAANAAGIFYQAVAFFDGCENDDRFDVPGKGALAPPTRTQRLAVDRCLPLLMPPGDNRNHFMDAIALIHAHWGVLTYAIAATAEPIRNSVVCITDGTRAFAVWNQHMLDACRTSLQYTDAELLRELCPWNLDYNRAVDEQTCGARAIVSLLEQTNVQCDNLPALFACGAATPPVYTTRMLAHVLHDDRATNMLLQRVLPLRAAQHVCNVFAWRSATWRCAATRNSDAFVRHFAALFSPQQRDVVMFNGMSHEGVVAMHREMGWRFDSAATLALWSAYSMRGIGSIADLYQNAAVVTRHAKRPRDDDDILH